MRHPQQALRSSNVSWESGELPTHRLFTHPGQTREGQALPFGCPWGSVWTRSDGQGLSVSPALAIVAIWGREATDGGTLSLSHSFIWKFKMLKGNQQGPAQWHSVSNHSLQHQHCLWVLFWIPAALPFLQLPTNESGKVVEDIQMPGLCTWCETQMEFLASTRPNLRYYGHLNQHMEELSPFLSLPHSLSNSVFQIT